MTEFIDVVDARDAVEHRAHLRLGQRAARRSASRRRSSRSRRYLSDARYCDEVVELLRVAARLRPLYDGIGAVGLSSVRRIAGARNRSPISVRSGPGPALPLWPIRWQPRQPEAAATSLAGLVLRRRRQLDLGRRAGQRALDRQVRHRARSRRRRSASRSDARSGCRSGLRSMNGRMISRTMQIVGMPIVAMNTSSGGLTTRSSSNRKKKYHSGPRRVGGRRRVGLGTELGAEQDRHQDDHEQHEDGHDRVLGDRVGEERLPLRLQDVVLAEVLLLLAGVHGGLDLFLREIALLLGLAATAARSCRAWRPGTGGSRSARRSGLG